MKSFAPPILNPLSSDLLSRSNFIFVAGLWLSDGELGAVLGSTGPEMPVPSTGQTRDFLTELAGFLALNGTVPQSFSPPFELKTVHPSLSGLSFHGVQFSGRSLVLGLSTGVKERLERRLTPGKNKKGRTPSDRGPSTAEIGRFVAVPASLADLWARKILPSSVDYPAYQFRSRPSGIGFLTLENDPVEGWRSWYTDGDNKPLFLVRLVPKPGRAAPLPSEGWQNILNHVIRQGPASHSAPLSALPRQDTLDKLPYWEYLVEAGPRNQVPASWTVQVFPSRRLLSSWAGSDRDPAETTVLLRLFKVHLPWAWGTPEFSPPPDRADTLGAFLASLDTPDLRAVVQNVLLPLTGAGGLGRLLFYKDLVRLSSRTVVKVLSSPWLPETQIEGVLGSRARQDLDQARRHGRVESYAVWRDLQDELCQIVENRLRSHELEISPLGQSAWETLYRKPFDQAQEKELATLVSQAPWTDLLSSDSRIGEDVLRSLDVTDAALCLRAVTDGRWRRLVTSRREGELKKEMEFLDILEARGELSLDRTLDAWRQFHRLWKEKTELWG